MRRQKKIFIFACLILWSFPLSAKEINHQVQYGACMSLVRSSPTEAFDAATHWKGLGGGDAAEHCAASALIALKQYKVGAERMEGLAQNTRGGEAFKAEILAQAAQGWLLADQLDHARAVLSAAIELNPDHEALYVDRGHVRSLQNAYDAALEDFNTALALSPEHVDALVFRASVYRLKGELDFARTDIEKAVKLDPSHPEGLLERGMVYRLSGQDDLARRDWMNVIGLGFSEASQLARINLQRMDAGLSVDEKKSDQSILK